MKADPETTAAVLDVVAKFETYYYNDLDADSLNALYLRDDDLVLIGTGEHEVRVAGEGGDPLGFHRDFEQIEAIAGERTWQSEVSAAGGVAWIAVQWSVRWTIGGEEGTGIMRRSFVFERRDGKWMIAHQHGSFPADQPGDAAWPEKMDALAFAVGADRTDFHAQAAPDGTVTLLFTDIEGSTTITERLGDVRWLELLRLHNSIIREQATEHGCYEVKSQGDGFMFASQSARRAVQCAIGIQRAFAEHNETAAEPIHVRIGLHAGEVLKDADDFFGKHVILASRIAGEARGGEILVSSLIKELTDSAGDVSFGEPRNVELKGLAGTHRVHEVRWLTGE
jgi:class 3 adenylate cyclase/ketosteroid isomerase-like protein